MQRIAYLFDIVCFDTIGNKAAPTFASSDSVSVYNFVDLSPPFSGGLREFGSEAFVPASQHYIPFKMLISRSRYACFLMIGYFLMNSAVAYLSVSLSPVPVAVAVQQRQRWPTTALRVVADPPMKGDEQMKGGKNNGEQDDWIPFKGGGFIPNIKSRLGFRQDKKEETVQKKLSSDQTPTKLPRVQEVLDIHQYKKEVADVRDQIVCVRFYAPWCRSCKSIEASFRRLPKDFPGVKFVEVPVTKDNAYLHKGLGIPSLPFGHIYEPSAGLVEERKMNKNVFAEFKEVLRTYVQGECPVAYDDDGNCVSL